MLKIIKYKAYRVCFSRCIAVVCLLISLSILQGCMEMVNPAEAAKFPASLTKGVRVAKKGVDFTIAIIPDIQYYTAQIHGGKVEMFRAQIQWIKNHQIDSNIVYVAGMGDTVDDGGNGDSLDQQWINATENGGYYALETPSPGIAYGVTVGNHDEADTAVAKKQPNYHNEPGIKPVRNTTINYNKYFGADHFKNKPYYGGHANILGKNNNDNHFDKFTVGGQKYIVVYLVYDNGSFEDRAGLLTKWADSVVKANSNAKAIIVSHGILKFGPVVDGQFPWQPQGERIYDALKANKNVLWFLCGHVKEGYREDVYNGHLIRTFMSDYQGEKNGGNGVMRTMKINTVTDSVTMRNFSPYNMR